MLKVVVEAVMFTTIMRTQISLAWIVGPPLSFFIALNWGFDYMYLGQVLPFYCVQASANYCRKFLVKVRLKNQEILDNTPPRKSVIYLFIANLLLWTCNSMYLIMPLFVINELHLNKELAGTLMGTAAGIEIPVMIFAGYLTKYFSKKALDDDCFSFRSRLLFKFIILSKLGSLSDYKCLMRFLSVLLRRLAWCISKT